MKSEVNMSGLPLLTAAGSSLISVVIRAIAQSAGYLPAITQSCKGRHRCNEVDSTRESFLRVIFVTTPRELLCSLLVPSRVPGVARVGSSGPSYPLKDLLKSRYQCLHSGSCWTETGGSCLNLEMLHRLSRCGAVGLPCSASRVR